MPSVQTKNKRSAPKPTVSPRFLTSSASLTPAPAPTITLRDLLEAKIQAGDPITVQTNVGTATSGIFLATQGSFLIWRPEHASGVCYQEITGIAIVLHDHSQP